MAPATLEEELRLLGEAIFAQLTPQEACVAACVSRRFNALACAPSLYARLSFDALTPTRNGAPRAVDDAALAMLCRRAGASLRFLDIRAGACGGITRAGLEAALQGVDRSMLELYEDVTLCYVCLDVRGDMLFFTCEHALCANCGTQLRRCCPMCRQLPRVVPLRVFL